MKPRKPANRPNHSTTPNNENAPKTNPDKVIAENFAKSGCRRNEAKDRLIKVLLNRGHPAKDARELAENILTQYFDNIEK